MNQKLSQCAGGLLGLLGLLLSGTACEQGQYLPGLTDQGTGVDQTAGSSDMLGPSPDFGPSVMTTIRDLNQGQQPSGTRVQFVGVVQSPVAYAYAVQQNEYCMYELVVVQASSSPTLQDGMVLRTSQRAVAPGMMITQAQCQQRAMTLPIGGVPRGHTAAVVGVLNVENTGQRVVYVTTGSVLDQGVAALQPTPVVVTPSQLVSAALGVAPMSFQQSSGALVRMDTVTTTDRNVLQQTFKVVAGGPDTTRVAPSYLRVANSAYMSPVDGTKLKSLIGLVSVDLGGTIWPRATDDLIP